MIIIHFSLLTVGIIFINFFFFEVDLLHPELKMDAGWYRRISRLGYDYTAGKQSSVAFYPLFAWIWRWTGWEYWGIVALNVGLLISSLYLLAIHYRLKATELLLLMAVPNLMFSFVPYSESIFFFGATLMLIGFKKEHLILTMIGVAVTCLSRSASAILILCFVFGYFINQHGKINWSSAGRYTVAIVTAILASVVVRWIQVSEGGVDFSMFEVQAQWNRHLSLPSFPFTTTTHKLLVWNDFLALFVGLACAVIILRYAYQRTRSLTTPAKPEWIIALLYIAGITATTLLFSGTYGERGTSIHSLNRFIFATPFFSVVLIHALQRGVINKKVITVGACLYVLTYLSFIIGSTGVYASLRFQLLTLGYFGLMSVIPALYFVFIHKPQSTWRWMVLYAVGLLLQACLYCTHLYGLRVG